MTAETAETPRPLREGFSTGACATALCVAGWHNLTEGVTLTTVDVLFPDGVSRSLALRLPAASGASGATTTSTAHKTFCIIKDGGDDPDCTHGAVIYGRLRHATLAEARPEDYLLAVGEATLLLRGVEGIGICTRPGLDCEQGKWAINIGPRAMIVANLERVGMRSGVYLAELGIERGTELAEKTLNPHLGIVGGLSLLGTTGLVRPFSHDAYIRTVELCVKSNALLGGKSMVFCTGGRTKAGAQRYLTELPETAFVCIGDFIAESLRTACLFEMQEIIVACMAGKLCKYASGFDNTHAHKVRQDMEPLLREVHRLLPEDTSLHDALQNCVSVREALLSVPQVQRSELLRNLAGLALKQLVGHCSGSGQRFHVRLLLFDFDGTLLMDVLP